MKKEKKKDLGNLPEMYLSSHFKFSEFTRSEVACRCGIFNMPPSDQLDEVVSNLTKLCKEVLEPIRKCFGHPVYINSGYRCSALNKAVGGVTNSRHLSGLAADITASDFPRLTKFVGYLEKSGVIEPKELIYHETYIHIAL